MTFNKFDLVWQESSSTIYVILSERMDIPHFEDGTASDYSNHPMKLDDPNEWQQTFEGYIAFNTLKQRYEIISERHNFNLVKDSKWGVSYIPFDQATSQNRIRLGLLNLSEELDALARSSIGRVADS